MYAGKADGRAYALFEVIPADPRPVDDAGKLYCKSDGALTQLYWCRNDGQIIPISLPDFPVNSVFGRTGDVVALAGDYDTDLITNNSGVPGATCTDALNQLDNDLSSLGSSVSTIAAQTATNTANIATNTAGIATNTANIATNTANIATNTAGIATNTANIATNTASIASNTTNIATNTTNIATNTTNIATNSSAIAALEAMAIVDHNGAGPFTLAAADRNKLSRVNHTSGVTLTVPKNATVPIAVGSVFPIAQWGAGTLTISPVDGTVTIRSRGGLMNAAGQYAGLTLTKVATDEWLLTGERA